MIATFGVIPEFKSITIESKPKLRTIDLEIKPPIDGPRWVYITVMTLVARDGTEYVGTNMTADEVAEWRALLSGDGEP